MATKHSELKEAIFRKYGADPRLRLWNNVTGDFVTLWGTRIHVGTKGAADILGIREDGKLIGIEVKCGTDKLRTEQIAWANMIRKFNGIVIEAREIQDVERVFE